MTWQLGGLIVGALAVCYGFIVAFGLRNATPKTRSTVVTGGAVLLLILGVLLVLLPLLGVY